MSFLAYSDVLTTIIQSNFLFIQAYYNNNPGSFFINSGVPTEMNLVSFLAYSGVPTKMDSESFPTYSGVFAKMNSESFLTYSDVLAE